MIRNISFQDVISALNAGPLCEDDMVACLNWWAKTYSANPSNSLLAIRMELLTAAVLLLGDQIIPLSTIKHFLNPRSLIPSDGPLPPNLLPVAISKHLTSTTLEQRISLDGIVNHRLAPLRLQSAGVRAFRAGRVQLDSLGAMTKAEVAGILKDIQCIPTSGGLKTPGESYFLKADLFHDLPVVTLASGTTLKPSVERLLADLGVRKHVDLQVVFTRMIKTQEWILSPAEWARLKMTAAFPKETKTSEKRTQCCAKDLYEPLEVFRQLGLPVLDWGQHKWRPTSDQAKILFDLGLLRFPPLDLLINLCAGSDQQIRTFALKYLVDNLATRYPNYDPGDFYEISYLPALKDNKPIMGSPKDVFINADYAVFGVFLVFAQPSDVALKLKVQQHPSTARIVTLLESTAPQGEAEARKWFGTLASRISDFSSAELKRLSVAPIVPTQSKDEKVISMRWLPPSQCFFGTTAKAAFHSKMFVFVDFGTAANGFLSACGTKDSPSIEQVTQMLLAEPAGIFKMAEGVANYLDFLRSIAVNHRQLSSATIARMKKASILLGSTRKPASGDTDYDDDNPIEQYDLKRGDEIVVADDNNALKNFGEYLFVAPQEDILEEFYLLLGSRRLSGLVKEDYKTTAELKGTQLPAQIRSLILERLPLFLHEHTHARTRVSFNWLNNEAHFIVTSFGKLSVTKSLAFGTIRKSKTQEASAVAKRAGSGPIHLWIAGNSQVDMYEVATSLNRLLFDSPKTNDALLFMTILSTDLKALKRRGYNVDRILKHQNAIRQAALEEQAKKAQLIAKPPAPTLPTIPTSTTSPLPLPPQQDPQDAPPPPEKSRPLSNMMSTFKKRFTHDDKHAREGNLLQNREQMQQVNESLNEGYCDISGRVGDLIAVGDISGVKVFVSQEVPDPHTFMPLKYEPLTRFAPIMKGLAEVYSLPLASLHIFYDLDGGLIAFNRNGSIFLNLRYYEAWHDAEVKAGSTRTAYISWFHTLAHELAHNLVGPHNSEHEFWFSSICERYFGQMANRLAL
ncbi:hypothetical protein MKEN_00668100 [Mycena kentingensis (nom. inval.)]|nr:hypothetical protein MKEN_00668100 [Mycena kentingensis (nom. inval.)]